MTISTTIFRIGSAVLLLATGAASQQLVGLSWQPAGQSVMAGDEVRVDLFATAVGPGSQSISGLDAIMTWDPAFLLFMGNDNAMSGYPWFVSGFLPQPDGLNVDLTDGEALFTALSSAAPPAFVPIAPGLQVTTMKFLALAPTASTSISFTPMSGMFGKTRVLDFANPNLEITGDIASTADVTITGAPRSYCTSKFNSLGCLPQIASSGRASVTDPNPFDVFAVMELNFRNGLYFYGYAGPAALPFFGGTLCVTPPLRRTSVQNAGGTPPPAMDCSGTFTFAMNALIQSGMDPLLVVGQQINGQYWSRDPPNPDGTGVALSNGIEFVIGL